MEDVEEDVDGGVDVDVDAEVEVVEAAVVVDVADVVSFTLTAAALSLNFSTSFPSSVVSFSSSYYRNSNDCVARSKNCPRSWRYSNQWRPAW